MADHYFAAVRDRNVEDVVALYADEAAITLPNGARVRGRDAIRAFQTDVHAREAPYPTPGPRIVEAREIAAEINAKPTDGNVQSAANFFYLDDAGRIARLSVYARSVRQSRRTRIQDDVRSRPARS